MNVYFRNKLTGQVTLLPAHYETHPILGKTLERVEPEDFECIPCGLEPVKIKELVDLEVTEPQLEDEVVESNSKQKKGNKNG